MIRILIADQYEVVRQGLRVHLAQPGWEVVAEAADGPEAIKKAIETKPDVAVLGYALAGLSGLEATRQIRAFAPKTEVLIHAANESPDLQLRLMEAGARGCVLMSEPIGRLIEGVQLVACRRPYFAGLPPADAFKKPNKSGSPLTITQRMVLQLVAEGQTNKQIARTLGIGRKTVETHRLNIEDRLGFSSPAQLVRYAIRNGLASA